MPELVNRTTGKILTPHLKVALTATERMKGLIGHPPLVDDEMLWIPYCMSIHTFFMSFPIDCVFLDDRLRVCTLKPRIEPWRIIWPIWRARSVIEMAAGEIEQRQIQIGDELYVGN